MGIVLLCCCFSHAPMEKTQKSEVLSGHSEVETAGLVLILQQEN